MLLTLNGCSSTQIRTEHLKIPNRLLECENLPEKTPTTTELGWERLKQGDYSILAHEVLNVSSEAYKNQIAGNPKKLIMELSGISSEAYDDAFKNKDHRLLFLEVTGNIIGERSSLSNQIHKTCVNNAADAREYQQGLADE